MNLNATCEMFNFQLKKKSFKYFNSTRQDFSHKARFELKMVSTLAPLIMKTICFIKQSLQNYEN